MPALHEFANAKTLAPHLNNYPADARLVETSILDEVLRLKDLLRGGREEVTLIRLERAILSNEAPSDALASMAPEAATLPRLDGVRSGERASGPADRLEEARRRLSGANTLAAKALQRAAARLDRLRQGAFDRPAPFLVYFPERRGLLREAAIVDVLAEPHRERSAEPVFGNRCRAGPELREAARRAMRIVRSSRGASSTDDGFIPLEISLGEGRIPIDGPSFGLALLALFGFLVRFGQLLPRSIGFTGALDAHGRVGRVGGIRAKLRAAFEEGVRLVFVPEANSVELGDVTLGLHVEVIPEKIQGEEILLVIEDRLAAHFPLLLTPDGEALEREFTEIRRLVRTNSETEQTRRRLVQLTHHASRVRDDRHRTLMACARWAEGYVAHHQGHVESCLESLSEANALFTELDASGGLDPLGRRDWLEVGNLMGIHHKYRYEFAESRRLLEANLALKRAQGADRASIAFTLGSLGQLAASCGAFDEALALQEQAQEYVPREERNRQANYIGFIHAAQGRWADAERTFARVIDQDGSAPPDRATQWSNARFARLYRAQARNWQGDAEGPAAYERALEDLEMVSNVFRQQPWQFTWILCMKGAALRGTGRLDEARGVLEQAEATARGEVEAGRTNFRGLLMATLAELARLDLAATRDPAPHLDALRRELGRLAPGAESFRVEALALVQPQDAALAEVVRRLIR